MAEWETLKHTDFKMLYRQKINLIEASADPSALKQETADGIVCFLDFLLDEAENNGLFTYPEDGDEDRPAMQSIIDRISRENRRWREHVIKSHSPEEIFGMSHEIQMRREIINMFECADTYFDEEKFFTTPKEESENFSDEELISSFALTGSFLRLFSGWEEDNTDSIHMDTPDDVHEAVHEFLDYCRKLLKEGRERNEQKA